LNVAFIHYIITVVFALWQAAVAPGAKVIATSSDYE